MDFFKDFSQFAGLMRQLPKIKEQVEQLQQKLGQMTAEGDAGGGMVRVRVNGRMEVLACTISDEAMRLGDREMLEDLVRAAANQALDRARQMVAQETASGLGLPPGMALPGMS